jgi:uncharacterized OsmC-like protein
VTWDGGLRFTAALRGHEVVTDQPQGAGGGDSAVTPLELMAVSLGSCIALYAVRFCAARGIDGTGLAVAVAVETEKPPYRIGRFAVTVRLPQGFPDSYLAAMDRAVRTCPVHNTLAHPPAIDIALAAATAVV